MEPAIQVTGYLADEFAAFAYDHSRLFRIDGDLGAHGGAVHLHAAVSCSLQLISQILIDQGLGYALGYELLFDGHQLFTSVRTISTVTVWVFLGVALPMARGIQPWMVLPVRVPAW